MSTTAPPLLESKSSLADSELLIGHQTTRCSKDCKPCWPAGVIGEATAVRWFESRGFVLLAHRYKCHFAEIDLLFFCRQQLHMVEVKGTGIDPARPVTLRQARRLKRAMVWLQSQFSCPVRAHLVVTSRKKVRQVYADFLCDLLNN